MRLLDAMQKDISDPCMGRSRPLNAGFHEMRYTLAMNLQHVRAFVAIAEEENLTRAAERLHLSPSAVSAHLQALESELSLTLFTRSSTGMCLTGEGQRLLPRAEAILSDLDALLGEAQTLQAELTGTLRVGINTSPAFLRVAALTTCLRDTHPGLTLQFIPSVTGHITEALRADTLDAGFIYGPTPNGTLNAIPLTRASLVVAAPPDWADRVIRADWDDLARLPWVFEDIYCPFQTMIEDIFKGQDLAIEQAVQTHDENTKSELVAGGLGLALMEKQEAQVMLDAGRISIAEPEPLTSLLQFVTPAHRAVDPLVRALLVAIRAVWEIED